jgi:predicted ATPase
MRPIAEAISLAMELNDMHGLAVTLSTAGWLAYFAHNRVEVERYASRLVEVATRQHFVFWLAGGKVFSGWARTAAGDRAEGISWINEGIQDFRAIGAIQLPGWLLLKAEALHLADRTADAFEVIEEAHAHIESYGERWPLAELHRLRALLLAATGGDNTKIEDSFRAAISTAKQQKLVSLEKLAHASYAEYRRHNPSAGTRGGLRLPLN